MPDAAVIELMVVDVDHRRGVATEHALLQPASVPIGRPGMVIPGAEVDALDLANAELGSICWRRDDVVRRRDERADGSRPQDVKANAA
jgi:hypothetical protein